MTNSREVDVTLSASLLRHLRAESEALGVSLEWLIASMIVDTVETAKGAGPIAA